MKGPRAVHRELTEPGLGWRSVLGMVGMMAAVVAAMGGNKRTQKAA